MRATFQESVWSRSILALVILGFIGSTPVNATEEEGWPREIETAKGLVVMYQPQLDSLEGDTLAARTAVMVRPSDQSEPIFGAAWIEARIDTDLDTRTVAMENIRVPRVHFPDAKPEHEQALIDLLTQEMPTWELEMSLDRMSAMLEIAEKQSLASEGFEDSPPKILFSQEPAVLISIDGRPHLSELGDTGLKSVVNTPFLIVQHPKGRSIYYLYAGSGTWYRAPAVEGPWEVTKKVPKKVRRLEPEDEDVDPKEAAEGPSTPPAIVVATEPSELIVTNGPPEYTPIAGSELLVVSNTESDVLREISSQRLYVLLSGRWFASPSTDGPWQLVPSDALPASFAAIDPDSDYGYLLAWVAGTEMAEETLLDAHIPQTAAIKRNATIQVTYDGEPKFEPVEETSLYYAVNTESQVIRAGSEYYCVEQGVWYVASSPKGPWRVATEVPEEIQAIPASSPVYNTKYVYVYDSTPEVVYVGYYPGYLNSYHYHGSMVYGTGWYYRPWWSPYHYYPRHRTWGFSVRYNPWYGWSFGLSYSTGRFTFSIGTGGWYRWGWWGPGGYRGYRRGYNRGWHRGYRSGSRAGYQAGYRTAQRDTARNLYQRQGNAPNVASTSRARGAGAAGAAGAAAARSPSVSSSRPNNVFADKQGNVHQKQPDGSWQTRQGGQWTKSDAASAASSRQRPSSATTRSSGSSLNRDANARQRGSQRARSAPRGGGARRGGGRRR